jgi:hypothetical protein
MTVSFVKASKGVIPSSCGQCLTFVSVDIMVLKILLFGPFPGFCNNNTGVANHDGTFRNISGNDRTGANDAVISNSCARLDKNILTHENILPDGNRFINQRFIDRVFFSDGNKTAFNRIIMCQDGDFARYYRPFSN